MAMYKVWNFHYIVTITLSLCFERGPNCIYIYTQRVKGWERVPVYVLGSRGLEHWCGPRHFGPDRHFLISTLAIETKLCHYLGKEKPLCESLCSKHISNPQCCVLLACLREKYKKRAKSKAHDIDTIFRGQKKIGIMTISSHREHTKWVSGEEGGRAVLRIDGSEV